MKKVQVLMSTYNGEKYLDEQIESLIAQKGVCVTILVRDDGSTDKTINKLKQWEAKGVLEWYKGENLKPALSFMDLIKNASKSDYYAFCDQDDVWDHNKLISAITMLEMFSKDEPSLYFSNTRLVDQNLVPIKSKMIKPKLTLGAALIINPVAGCTEVFNYAFINIIRLCGNVNISMHDSWTYKLCMAIGGNIVFDYNSHIAYRQHENNVVGGKSNFRKKLRRRVKNVLTERNRIRENYALELLKGYSNLIPKENLKMVQRVAFYRNSFKNKIQLLFDKEIKTNSFEHNFSFICAVLFDAF